MRLARIREPFDSPDWIFEVKHDGFRALAYLEKGRCRLISRNGHEFRGFGPLCDAMATNVDVKEAIIDGELCCLGDDGRSYFNRLLFRSGDPHLYAFDLLWLNGRDVRTAPLVPRKRALARILRGSAGAPILYADHVDGAGVELFRAACERDLEGIVAKRKDAPYECDERVTTWVKIKNPDYTQVRGRHELFDRQRRRTAAAGVGRG